MPTVGAKIDEYLAAGFSTDEITKDFRDSYGVDVDNMPPETPLDSLKKPQAKPTAESLAAPFASMIPPPPKPAEPSAQTAALKAFDRAKQERPEAIIKRATPQEREAYLGLATDYAEPALDLVDTLADPNKREMETQINVLRAGITIPATFRGATTDFILGNSKLGDIAGAAQDVMPITPGPTSPMDIWRRVKNIPDAPGRFIDAVSSDKPWIDTSTERFTDPAEQIAAMAHEKNVDTGTVGGTLGKVAANTASSMGNFVSGLFEIGNKYVGLSMRPENTTDEELKQEYREFGKQVAGGATVGTAALASGALKGVLPWWGEAGENSFLVDPIGTLATVLDPTVSGALAKTPKAAAALKSMRNDVGAWSGRLWDAAADPLIARDTRANARAYMRRQFVDGMAQGDKMATALAERLVYGGEDAENAIKAIGEWSKRRIRRGDVELQQPDLVARDVTIEPVRDVRAAEVAATAADKAATEAGKVGRIADIATAAKESATTLKREVGAAQGEANRAQGRIAKASDRIAKASDEAMDRIGATQEKQGAAVWDLADTTVALVDRLGELPEVIKSEILQSRAAKAFQKAQAEYIEAARAGEGAAEAAQKVGAAAEDLAAKQTGTKPPLQPKASERAAVLALKRYESASESLADKVTSALKKMQDAGADAATAGVGLAEKVKGIGAAPATAALASETASLLRTPVRKAERAVERAADVAETAGTRPAVAGGQVYLPKKRTNAAGRILDVLDKYDTLVAGGNADRYLNTLRDDIRVGKLGEHETWLAERGVSIEDIMRVEDEVLAGTIDDTQPVRASEIDNGTIGIRAGEVPLGDPDAAVAANAAVIQQIRDSFPGTSESAARDIYSAAVAASDLKQAAIEAGFDPAGPLYPEARKVAEQFKDRAVGVGDPQANPTDVLAARMEQIGVPKAAARKTAEYLQAEVALRDQMKRTEVPGGVIRRPPSETLRVVIDENGKNINAPRATEAALYDDAPTTQPELRAQREAELMQDRTLESGPPASYLSTDQNLNAQLRRAGEITRDAGYYADEPGTFVSGEPFDMSGMTPDQFNQVANRPAQRVSPERFMQRNLEALDANSPQLMRIGSVRQVALNLIEDRLKGYGLPLGQRKAIVVEAARQLSDKTRVSSMSKSRLLDMYLPDGRAIWTPDDYRAVFDSLPERTKRGAQADVLQQIIEEQARGAKVYKEQNNLYQDINRFRLDDSGAPIAEFDSRWFTKEDGTPVRRNPWGDALSYAEKVAADVILDGKMRPYTMPFSGEAVSSKMRTIANEVRKTDQLTAQQIDQLASTIQDRFAVVPESVKKRYAEAWREQYRGADQPQSGLENVHMDKGIADSIGAHLFMTVDLTRSMKLLSAVMSRAKSGLVAENLKTLINNNIANTLLDTATEANPIVTSEDAILRAWELKKYRDGNVADMLPEDQQMYRAIDEAGIPATSNLVKDIGEGQIWQALGDTLPGLTEPIEAMNVKMRGVPGKVAGFAGKFSDAHRAGYSDLGDVPFRVGKSVRVYKSVTNLVDNLGAGHSIDMPVSEAQFVRVTDNGNGTVTIVKGGGPKARGPEGQAITVAKNSDEMAKVKALVAKYEQQKLYADYSKLGNWGKYLRGSGPTSLMSGIFSWLFFAMDIPGVKPGLVKRALDGPTMYETTSPTARAIQAKERLNLSLKRAALVGMARETLQDENGRAGIREMASFNPNIEGTFLAMATDPWHLNVRDTGTTSFAGPSQQLLNTAEWAAQAFAYGGLLDDPKALREMLRVTKADLAAMEPEDRERVMRNREYLYDYAEGRRVDLKKTMTMIGMGGHPLFNTVMKMQSAAPGQFDGRAAASDFMKQMFGGTVWSIADVAQAYGDKLGIDIGDSTFGKERERKGFRGGIEPPSVEELARWSVRQLVGFGWREIYMGKRGETNTTGKVVRGRLESFLFDAQRKLEENLTASAQKAIKNAKTPEDKRSAVLALDTIKRAIRKEISSMSKDIEAQYKLMRHVPTLREHVEKTYK